MPRPSVGARLTWENETRRANGSLINSGGWVIRDGQHKRRTGCAKSALVEAQAKLAEYIFEKNTTAPTRLRVVNIKDPAEISVVSVLTLYVSHKLAEVSRPKGLLSRVSFLEEFWGDKLLSEVDGETCRAYAKSRIGKPWRHSNQAGTGNVPRLLTSASVRRELEDLQAAINYHRREGKCDRMVTVWLPAKTPPRSEFLTRSEAAKLLWSAWRSEKHIARFILMGLYTGTRHNAICGASLTPGPDLGHVDVDAGVYHRLREGRRETKKRQPSIRLPRKLRVHIARWKRLGIVTERIVEWEGGGVTSVRKGFLRAVQQAGLRETITPHILRHTCATWAMKKRVNLWEAAHFLGMTQALLERVYGKHTLDDDDEPVANPVVTRHAMGMNAAFNSPRMIGRKES